MSNTINAAHTPFETAAADHAGGASQARDPVVSKPSAAPERGAGTAETAEIVSLSSDATASTQLLHAARTADGVDQSAVQRLKSAIQAGTYNVSPDKLARSIIGAMKDMT